MLAPLRNTPGTQKYFLAKSDLRNQRDDIDVFDNIDDLFDGINNTFDDIDDV